MWSIGKSSLFLVQNENCYRMCINFFFVFSMEAQTSDSVHTNRTKKNTPTYAHTHTLLDDSELLNELFVFWILSMQNADEKKYNLNLIERFVDFISPLRRMVTPVNSTWNRLTACIIFNSVENLRLKRILDLTDLEWWEWFTSECNRTSFTPHHVLSFCVSRQTHETHVNRMVPHELVRWYMKVCSWAHTPAQGSL